MDVEEREDVRDLSPGTAVRVGEREGGRGVGDADNGEDGVGRDLRRGGGTMIFDTGGGGRVRISGEINGEGAGEGVGEVRRGLLRPI